MAHNILERIDVQGKEVLVIGCGPVGLLCCSVAKVSVNKCTSTFPQKLDLRVEYNPKIGTWRVEGNRC